MRFLRNKRLLGLGALGALFALMLLIVLPALASNPGDFVLPASGDGVAPYDMAVGGTGDCGNLFTGTRSLGPVSEYDNVNPKTKAGLASGNGDGVTFDLTLNTDSNKNQTLNVTGHGAAILGIGIKGGTQSTAYNYKAFAPAGYVARDTGLHAPAQSFTTSTTGTTTNESVTQFYSISQLSVCYTVLSFISGNVYQDSNQNGTNDDSSPRIGWTVNLYAGVTPGTAGGGQLIAHQVTTDGSYRFDIPANGTHYRVCEVPKVGDSPSNGGSIWVQTQPMPSTMTLCNGASELPKGYDYTPTSSTGKSDADFGNVGGYSCNAAPVGINPYTVGECKADETYVFNAGTFTSGPNNGVPFVSYFVGDPGEAQIPVVELINFPDPFTNGQPAFTKLLYADGGGFPVSFNDLTTMPYCKLDPRQSGGLALNSSYDTAGPESDLVLPGTTSCLISIRITAPAPGGSIGALQAYVYALGDSARSPG